MDIISINIEMVNKTMQIKNIFGERCGYSFSVWIPEIKWVNRGNLKSWKHSIRKTILWNNPVVNWNDCPLYFFFFFFLFHIFSIYTKRWIVSMKLSVTGDTVLQLFPSTLSFFLDLDKFGLLSLCRECRLAGCVQGVCGPFLEREEQSSNNLQFVYMIL